MDAVSYQPHTRDSIALFNQRARVVDVTGALVPGGMVVPGLSGARRPGLAGLGDWFSDGVNALSNLGLNAWGAMSGQTAQRDAQNAAAAIAQAQAAAQVAEAQSFQTSLMFLVGGAVGLGTLVYLMKK